MNKKLALNESTRRQIETDISLGILNNPDIVWDSVKKISDAIVRIIEQQLVDAPQQLYNVFSSTLKILYSEESFARLGEPDDMPMIMTTSGNQPDIKKIVETIVTILKSDDPTNLATVMNLHAEFGGHVLKNLQLPGVKTDGGRIPSFRQLATDKVAQSKKARESLRKRFYMPRPRTQREGMLQRTPLNNPVGIIKKPKPAASDTTKTFIRAADRFEPKTEHPYYQSTSARGIPFVAGPSGHAGILLRSALTMCDLSIEELQQYLLATVGMVVGGGMHGFHEIMIQARGIGLPYIEGSYFETFPKCFLKHPIFKTLGEKYNAIKQTLAFPYSMKDSDADIFFDALRAGDSAITADLIHLGISLDLNDSSNQTALEYAILLGHEDIAAQLVRAGADISMLGDDCINQCLWENWTELALACLERGARTDIVSHFGQRAIDHAIEHKNYQWVEILLQRGEILPMKHPLELSGAILNKTPLLTQNIINRLDRNQVFTDYTAFMTAVAQGNVSVEKQLIAKGAKINAKNSVGKNALHIAAMHGRTKTVAYLLDHLSDEDVNATDIVGNTAIHYAIKNGFSKITELLMEKSDLTIRNIEQETALDMAQISQYEAIQDLFDVESSETSSEEKTSEDIAAGYDDELTPFVNEWQQLKNSRSPLLFLSPEFSLSKQKKDRTLTTAIFEEELHNI